jgi:TatD DNase family protein
MIDTHTHLTFPEFEDEREEVLARAARSGVEGILEVGTSLAQSRKALQLAQRYQNIAVAVGVHPHEADFWGKEQYRRLRKLAGERKVVAVGEIGLDYARGSARKETQVVCFTDQLLLAQEQNLPVILHMREAFEDMIYVLKNYAPLRGVVHTFSGSVEMARTLLQQGLWLSFSGVVTYPGAAEEIKEAAKLVPADRYLIETDCPFLAPAPHRGKRNEPAFVRFVAEQIAEWRGESFARVAAETARNARKLFNFPF